jgi:diamine N-acetyltransferase
MKMERATPRHSVIALRAVEPEDLALLYLWENDRTVWHVSNTLVPFSRYQLKQYIESDPGDVHAHRQLRMMIDSVETGKPTRTVGIIDLFDFDPIHRRAGLGILIASADDRRQGYACEAIQQMIEYSRKNLFLHQLYCNIAASNTASIQLFGKAGFEITGTKKEWLQTESGWEDEYLMQLKIEN